MRTVNLSDKHHVVHTASLAAYIRRVRSTGIWIGSVIGLFAGIGLSVVVVLVYAHRHGLLY